MLKILLDARKLGDGGIGTYIWNLANGLLLNPEVSLSILVARGRLGEHFSTSEVPQIEEGAGLYSIDETFFLGKRISALCDKLQTDIFHAPHFTLPRNIKTASVVTIHDIIQITNPERWYYPIAARFLIKRALREAKKVIVVSDATKLALIKEFAEIVPGLHQKLEVIPNAIAENFLVLPEDWQKLILDSFKLNPGYLFALFSMLKPHKGFSDLIEAYHKARSVKDMPKLVVAGKGLADMSAQSILKLQETGIEVLGEVSESELAALHKGARATVVPSRVEGFGFSALEARVLGTPLLLRPVPSLLSIAGPGDFICNDLSVSSLEKALLMLDERIPQWEERSCNYNLLSAYSIQSVTERTVEVYKSIF